MYLSVSPRATVCTSGVGEGGAGVAVGPSVISGVGEGLAVGVGEAVAVGEGVGVAGAAVAGIGHR